MENYIVINGKKAELTPEQLEALGIEVPKANAFKRASSCERFYFIDCKGEVFSTEEEGVKNDDVMYAIANYCTDKALMEQRALHEILYRQLWSFSMIHNGDKLDWDDAAHRYYIYYDHFCAKYRIGDANNHQTINTIYFYSKEIAQRAIDEIIKPFITEHPNFKW